MICNRCETHRPCLPSESGEELANRYSYAEGHKIPGGRMDGEERNLIRLRSLQALLDH